MWYMSMECTWYLWCASLMCVWWTYGVSDVCVFLFSCCVLMVHVTCEFQVDLPSHVMTLVKFFASLSLNFHI